MDKSVERLEVEAPQPSRKPVVYTWLRLVVLASAIICFILFISFQSALVLLSTSFWSLLCGCVTLGTFSLLTEWHLTANENGISPTQDKIGDDDAGGDDNDSLEKKCWHRRRMCEIIFLASFAVLTLVVLLCALVLLGVGGSGHTADYVMTWIVTNTTCALCGIVVVMLLRRHYFGKQTRPQPSSTPCWKCLGPCVAFVLFPIITIFAVLGMWGIISMSTEAVTSYPPGELVRVRDDLSLHLYCVGPVNASRPTVLFLHGFRGSQADVSWVRRDYRIAGLLRFCAIDRPGYGFSSADPAPKAQQHFGRMAELTALALKSKGVRGGLVLLYHSLGGYHALALGAYLRDNPSAGLRLVGGVAVDAMDPRDRAEYADRFCSTKTPVGSDSWSLEQFHRLLRVTAPSGLNRLLYVLDYSGLRTILEDLPEDVHSYKVANGMTLKFFDATWTEASSWSTNCGYALAGAGVTVADSAFYNMSRLEVITVSDEGDEEAVTLANLVPAGRAHVVRAYEPVTHESVLFKETDAARIVVPALLRVINATT